MLDTKVVAGSVSRKNCRPPSGRVEVCADAYGYRGWLGFATIWLTSAGHITQGGVQVNYSYFALSAYNSSQERHHTICQEIGHTLGLDHPSEDRTSISTRAWTTRSSPRPTTSRPTSTTTTSSA